MMFTSSSNAIKRMFFALLMLRQFDLLQRARGVIALIELHHCEEFTDRSTICGGGWCKSEGNVEIRTGSVCVGEIVAFFLRFMKSVAVYSAVKSTCRKKREKNKMLWIDSGGIRQEDCLSRGGSLCGHITQVSQKPVKWSEQSESGGCKMWFLNWHYNSKFGPPFKVLRGGAHKSLCHWFNHPQCTTGPSS